MFLIFVIITVFKRESWNEYQKFKRYQVIEKILNLLKEKQMTMEQVAKTLQMEIIVTRNLFKFLREHLIVESTGKKKRRSFFI